MHETFYKVSEAAKILNISESTLRRMIENEEVDYSRPTPRTTRIPHREIERLKNLKRFAQVNPQQD